MPEPEPRLNRFGVALAKALAAKDWSQSDLARALNLASPSAVSQWCNGRTEPTSDKVFATERALALKPGTLSRHLGYLPLDARNITRTREAIASDTNLTDRDRRMLLAIYDEAVR